MEKNVKLSLTTAKEMYKAGGSLKQFALDNFTEEELTKKTLPTKWEDLDGLKGKGYFISSLDNVIKPVIFSDINSKGVIGVYPTEELAKASVALAKLLHLRDIYRDGWVPDYTTSNQVKYCIFFESDKAYPTASFYSSRVLSFQTATIRDKFISTFLPLIKEAKELL